MPTDGGAPLIGSVLDDRYELLRHLARGDMSDVYAARDHRLRRAVAVKVYRPDAPVDRERFGAEILALVASNSPGAVQVYDTGKHDGHLYVVLELVEAPTLETLLRERGALPPLEATALGVAVADAIAFVHAAGAVHRAVHPGNVLCAHDGSVRLVDLGSPRVATDPDAVGKPAYLAPEQVEGDAVSPATDVYALGVLVLELLTGRAAFDDSRDDEELVIDLDRDADIGVHVPRVLRPILRQMTSREPRRRPPAAVVGDRLAALVRAAQVPGVSFSSPSPIER